MGGEATLYIHIHTLTHLHCHLQSFWNYTYMYSICIQMRSCMLVTAYVCIYLNIHTMYVHTHNVCTYSFIYTCTLNRWGGWVYLCLFICLSAGAIEWYLWCFIAILLHHAPVKLTSVLVLLVIFRGFFLVLICRYAQISFLLLLWRSILWLFILLGCIEGTDNELEVIDYNLELTFYSSSDLLSVWYMIMITIMYTQS